MVGNREKTRLKWLKTRKNGYCGLMAIAPETGFFLCRFCIRIFFPKYTLKIEQANEQAKNRRTI
jgi:hypothetical protein